MNYKECKKFKLSEEIPTFVFRMNADNWSDKRFRTKAINEKRYLKMNSFESYIAEFRKNIFIPISSVETDLPDKKGLYLICVNNFNNLPDVLKELEYSYFSDRPILYLGISGSRGLRKRDYKNHFTGTARNSTLRKSLGSLFGYSKVQYDNDIGSSKYKFNALEEDKLTEWMKTNLIMYYCVTEDDVGNIETELIKQYNPPLNISKNKNEVNKKFRKYLSQLRCEI